MTPATRLLEAVRSLISEASMCGRDTPERAVRDALVGVRALYPSAHALGDRVSVVYPDERPGFTGVVVGVEFHTDGVDYRVKGDADPDYTVVEAGFVRAAPRTLPLYRAPGVSGGPDWTVEDVVVGEPPKERLPYVATEVNTRTNTLVIPNRVQITHHTDEHGVKTAETVDLRDLTSPHGRLIEELRAEMARNAGESKDFKAGMLAGLEYAVDVAERIWPKV